MAGLNGTITIEWQRRRGKVTTSDYYRRKYQLENKEYDCLIHGIFSVGDSDGTDIVAVCELQSGILLEATLEHVKFVDTEEYLHEDCTTCTCSYKR